MDMIKQIREDRVKNARPREGIEEERTKLQKEALRKEELMSY